MMDIIAYDDAKSKGNNELLPIELTERLINGESPLRIYREYRGFTQTQLATKVDLTQATIAELEKGKQKGSIETWKTLEDKRALLSILNNEKYSVDTSYEASLGTVMNFIKNRYSIWANGFRG